MGKIIEQRFGAKNRDGTDPREFTVFILEPRFHGEPSMMDVRTAAAKAAANTGDCQLDFVLYLLVIYVELVKLIWGWDCFLMFGVLDFPWLFLFTSCCFSLFLYVHVNLSQCGNDSSFCEGKNQSSCKC